MKNKKPTILKYIKESQEAHKKRTSSGVTFRTAVFDDKRRKLREKTMKNEEKQ